MAATRLNDLLDKVFKVVPDYIVRKLEVDNPIFEKIKKVESETPFYLVERYGLRGTVQGFDADSLNDTITNNLSEYNFIKPYDSLVGIAGVHKFTQGALEKITTDNNALYDFASGLTEDITNVLMLNIKKLFYTPLRNGNTPAIAVATLGASNLLPSGTSDFTLTLDTTNGAIGAWLMDVGDVYDIYVSGDLKMTVRVKSIADSRASVAFNILYNTLSSNLTSGTAYFHIQNTYGKNFVNYPFIASTNRTLHNVDSTNYPIWNGIVYTPTSSALTKSVIRALVHKFEVKFQRPDIKRVSEVYTTRWQIENLENDLTGSGSIFRIVANVGEDKLEWGFGVKVDNVNVYHDPFVPPTYAYAPNVEYLQLRYFKRPEWLKLGGEIIHPDSLTTPQVLRAVLRWDIQFATEYPDYQAKITGLTSDFSFS